MSQVVSQITNEITPSSRILGEIAEVVNHFLHLNMHFCLGSKQRHHVQKDNFLQRRRQKCFGIAAWLQNRGTQGVAFKSWGGPFQRILDPGVFFAKLPKHLTFALIFVGQERTKKQVLDSETWFLVMSLV